MEPLAARGNLPQPLTSFVDRESEAAQIRRLLAGQRLLVLTGAPGCGKTRLALTVANEVQGNFEFGAHFVSLAPVGDSALVASAIAHPLGVQEMSQRPMLDALIDALRDKHVLLVLDNFEHVIEAAPDVARLLQWCPRVTALVTSRERLRLRGERDVDLRPLALPERGRVVSKAALAESAAGELLLRRLADARPDLAIMDEAIPTLTALCHRLDGLPLAIELTAPYARFFSLPELLERLERPLDVLTEGARDLPPRHRTLRDAVHWSYRLLDAAEHALFRRLAVFAGGWTREAAAAVCSPAGAPLDDMVRRLASLVDKSLLRQDESASGGGGQVRYQMLETIREFAREQLAASDELEETERRHAAYFTSLAEQAEPHLYHAEQCLWLDRLERELDNLRAALRWSRNEPAGETGLRLAGRFGGSAC